MNWFRLCVDAIFFHCMFAVPERTTCIYIIHPESFRSNAQITITFASTVRDRPRAHTYVHARRELHNFYFVKIILFNLFFILFYFFVCFFCNSK